MQGGNGEGCEWGMGSRMEDPDIEWNGMQWWRMEQLNGGWNGPMSC